MTAKESSVMLREGRKVQYRFGNPIDLYRLKRNVQRNYREQIKFWKEKAESLSSQAKPVKECILCGSPDYEVVGTTYGWPWHQCKGCTHVYNGRRLSPEQYLEFYKTVDEPINYSDTYTDEEIQDYRMKFVASPKVDYIIQQCQNKGKKWLDVATGNGDIVYLAKQKGYQAKGIEINPDAVSYGKRKWGADIYLGRIEDFEKENTEKWDIISFLGISDIIVNPVEYIQIAYRMLNDHGTMAMSFPNFNSLSRAVQFTYPDQLVCRFLYPSVLSSYTEGSATRAIEKEGFRIIATWFFGMDLYELINNLSVSDERFHNSQVSSHLRERMNELQLVFDTNKMGDEFLMIARKESSE